MMPKSHVIDPYGSCNPLKSSQKEIITIWSIIPPEKLAILVGSCCLRSIRRSSGCRGENREETSLLQSVPGVTPTFLCLKFLKVRIETKFASSITVCCWCIWLRRPRLSSHYCSLLHCYLAGSLLLLLLLLHDDDQGEAAVLSLVQ